MTDQGQAKRRRLAEAEAFERRLRASPQTTQALICPVVDVLPGVAADGSALVFVDLHRDGSRIQARRGKSASPAYGDEVLVLMVDRIPVVIDVLVGEPPPPGDDPAPAVELTPPNMT